MKQEKNFLCKRSRGLFQSSGTHHRRRVWRGCLSREGKEKRPQGASQISTEGSHRGNFEPYVNEDSKKKLRLSVNKKIGGKQVKRKLQ